MLNKLSLITSDLAFSLRSFCSRVFSSGSSPCIIDWFVKDSEGVSVVVTDSSKSVIRVIESLPLVPSVSHVFEVSIVKLCCFFKELVELHKVKSYNSSEFSSVKKDKELRLNSGIEVQLDKRSLVTVHSDVSELSELVSSIFVVLLNLLNDWVPGSCEVEESEGWSVLVQILHDFR